MKHARDRSASRVSAHLQPIPHLRLFQTARDRSRNAGAAMARILLLSTVGLNLDCVRIVPTMSLLDVVKYAYAAMFTCVLGLEITRSSRLARRSAQTAIVLATLGGSTWVYAAHVNRAPFDEDSWRVPPRHAGAARNPEDEDGELRPDDGSAPAERQSRNGHRDTSTATARRA